MQVAPESRAVKGAGGKVRPATTKEAAAISARIQKLGDRFADRHTLSDEDFSRVISGPAKDIFSTIKTQMGAAKAQFPVGIWFPSGKFYAIGVHPSVFESDPNMDEALLSCLCNLGTIAFNDAVPECKGEENVPLNIIGVARCGHCWLA